MRSGWWRVRWKKNRIVTGFSESDIKNQADVLDLRTGQVLENRYQIEELIVVGVRKPTANGHRVLRVEYIRRGRVVDNDRLLQVAPDLRKILDVVTLVVVAALPEQPVVDYMMDV